MAPVKWLRTLVAVEIGLLVLSILASIRLEHTLPAALQTYVREHRDAPVTGVEAAVGTASFVWLAFKVVSWVGLFRAVAGSALAVSWRRGSASCWSTSPPVPPSRPPSNHARRRVVGRGRRDPGDVAAGAARRRRARATAARDGPGAVRLPAFPPGRLSRLPDATRSRRATSALERREEAQQALEAARTSRRTKARSSGDRRPAIARRCFRKLRRT